MVEGGLDVSLPPYIEFKGQFHTHFIIEINMARNEYEFHLQATHFQDIH